MDLGQKYKAYLEEKHDTKVLETSNAFMTYQLAGDTVTIDILYVDKAARKSGEGTAIWEVLKEMLPENVHTCFAEIDIFTHSPEVPLVAFIKRGFKILKLDGSKIVIYNKFRGEV